MAVVWDPQTGDIPSSELGYDVSEETTDDKLSALYFTPTYYDPVKEETRSGSEVKVTDSALLAKYQESGDIEDAKPALSMSGEWYQAKGSAPSEYTQKADFYAQQARKMMQTCSNFTGVKYDQCVRSVNARIQQMTQKALPTFSSGGLVKQPKEPTMMNRNMYPQGYAEGGMPMMEEAMPGLMEPPMPEEDVMEQEQATMLEGILEPEEMDLLANVVEQFPELIPVLDKIDMAIGGSEFEGEGPVSGPGTETSDSIPAKLSDGEFVFTAKAVKQLGVDKLRKMMDKAEADYDASMSKQEEMQGMGFARGGYAIGGTVNKLAEKAGSLESATVNYQQQPLLDRNRRVDGMGRDAAQGAPAMLARETVNLQDQQRQAIRPRFQANERNMNQQSMLGQAPTAAAAGTPRASMETEMGRADMRQKLETAAQEDQQQPSLMMV